MLFNTLDFIVFFIVVITALVIIKERKIQHLIILFGSYFFFYYSSNYYIVLLIFTTLWDFYLGRILYGTTAIRKRKMIFITSLAGNLGLLGFFKYADFAITQFNVLGNVFDLGAFIPSLNLVLPIGISFYTFHSVGYMTDIYRGAIKPANSLREYAIFISFFPQLVAGPILRAKEFLPQLREKIENASTGIKLRQITLVDSNFRFGITLMAIGFFKKMFFADNVKILADQVFQNPIGLDSFTVILGTIAFGIQIYCDFSGYSDIALGAALVLGFKLPMNFNKPYFATSPSDFWKRWHISLSSWLRDYLYVGLGGNRKSIPRTLMNLMIVMVLGGLWHGASLNFVVWGIMHGSYLSLYKAGKHALKKHDLVFFRTPIGVLISILTTQYLIFLTWIPFRVRDFDHMVYSMQKFVFLDFKTDETINLIMTNHKSTVVIIVIFLILSIISYRKKDMVQKISELKTPYWLIFLTLITLLVLFFYVGNTNDFIYFQF